MINWRYRKARPYISKLKNPTIWKWFVISAIENGEKRNKQDLNVLGVGIVTEADQVVEKAKHLRKARKSRVFTI